MSIMRHKRYVQAADELKAALVNYCQEVRMTAPELAEQVAQFQKSVLLQDNVIFNLLRNREDSNAS